MAKVTQLKWIKLNLTIRKNLELASKGKMSDEDVVTNLKYANAWEFVKNLKNGLDQQLGLEYEDGVDSSVGQ